MKKNERLLDAVADIPAEYINEARPEECRVISCRKKKTGKIIAAAACIALALSVPAGYLILNNIISIPAAYNTENAVSEAINATKMGYRTGFDRGFTCEISTTKIVDGEFVTETIAEDFSSLFGTESDFFSSTDAFYDRGMLCTISETTMSFTRDGKTVSAAASFPDGSRILGIDSEGYINILTKNDAEGTALIRKFSSECTEVSSLECSADSVWFARISGFDSIENTGDSITVHYTAEGTEGTLTCETESDGSVLMRVSQGENEQIIRTGTEEGKPEFVSGAEIFSYDDQNSFFSANGDGQMIRVDSAPDERVDETNKKQVAEFTSDEHYVSGGHSYEAFFLYRSLEYSLAFHGWACDTLILERDSAYENGMNDADIAAINRSLRAVPADADGGASFIGKDGETGYIAVAGGVEYPEVQIFRFNMNGSDSAELELYSAVPFRIDEAMMEKISDFGFGASVYYNGACYVTAEFKMNDGSIMRHVYVYDSNGKSGYALIPAGRTSENDMLGIKDGEVGFIRENGSFLRAEFVYD